MYYIYKITSPSGKNYIGITKNLTRRKREHTINANKNTDRLNRRKIVKAYKKYGADDMSFEHIFCAFNQECAKEIEIELIKYYNCFNKGYNMTEGGDSTTITRQFTEKEVDEIRDLLEFSNMSQNMIAKQYNTTRTRIHAIKYNKEYCDLGKARVINRPVNTQVRGNKVSLSKLDDDKVRDILVRYEQKRERVKDICNLFGITRQTLYSIVLNKTWKHVKREFKITRRHRGNSKFTEKQVRKLWKMKKLGYSIREIADHYNLNYTTLHSIFNGKNWKDLYEEYNESE